MNIQRIAIQWVSNNLLPILLNGHLGAFYPDTAFYAGGRLRGICVNAPGNVGYLSGLGGWPDA